MAHEGCHAVTTAAPQGYSLMTEPGCAETPALPEFLPELRSTHLASVALVEVEQEAILARIDPAPVGP